MKFTSEKVNELLGVDEALKGVDFKEYQLKQNRVFDQFMNRLEELKKGHQ
ncbi:hypothetical protein [Leuconostoc falkenbergense]|nr:hypothetical protein [Leuconostoc falkenbergense]